MLYIDPNLVSYQYCTKEDVAGCRLRWDTNHNDYQRERSRTRHFTHILGELFKTFSKTHCCFITFTMYSDYGFIPQNEY